MSLTNSLLRQLHAEKNRIVAGFASNPKAKYRVVTKVAKLILLNGPYLLNGRFWEIKLKSLGAGVYELGMELQK